MDTSILETDPVVEHLMAYVPFKNESGINQSDSSRLIGDAIYYKFAVVQIICIFMIGISNLLVFVTVLLVRKLHTPDNCIIGALAVSDFLVGIWNAPIYIISDLPQTNHLLKQQRWSCVMRYASVLAITEISLSLLVFMCMERFSSIKWPLLYKKYVTNRKVISVTVAIVLAEVIQTFVAYGVFMPYRLTESNLSKRCSHQNTPDEWGDYLSIKHGCLVIISSCASIYVVVIALRSSRARRRSESIYSFKYSTETREQARNKRAGVRITAGLMFLYIILWAPSILIPVAGKWLSNKYKFSLYILYTRLPRLLNSAVNVCVYAFARPIYRQAYVYLLTTPPCRWRDLQNKLRRKRAKSEMSTDSSHAHRVRGLGHAKNHVTKDTCSAQTEALWRRTTL